MNAGIATEQAMQILGTPRRELALGILLAANIEHIRLGSKGAYIWNHQEVLELKDRLATKPIQGEASHE